MSEPRTPGSTVLTLVRHGQTAANTGGVWHGSTDTPLSDHGQGQAAKVADRMARHVDEHAWTSYGSVEVVHAHHPSAAALLGIAVMPGATKLVRPPPRIIAERPRGE